MRAILMIVIWFASGSEYHGFDIEPAKCEEARKDFLMHNDSGLKATATCIYEDRSV